LKGTILPGAMPALHRWVGNPVLTGLLNLVVRSRMSDAHCGLRMVKAEVVPKLQLSSPGMEFASEMVIKAARLRLNMVETPITYRPRRGQGGSKLRAIPDGLRHVRYILAYAAQPLLWLLAGGLAVLSLAVSSVGNSGIDVVAGEVGLAAAASLAVIGLWSWSLGPRISSGGALRVRFARVAGAAIVALTLVALSTVVIFSGPRAIEPLGDSPAALVRDIRTEIVDIGLRL
ncbi:MAG: hypothetical protein M3290_13625, partial [Actinomycetota bacterium]|nr:hypothetical protein [Actinomycetota bacterium]